MSLLNDLDNTLTNAITPVKAGDANGFAATSVSSSDGNGLPQSKIRPGRAVDPALTRKRDLIKWFVPEVGIVNMYINPSSLAINYKKVIQQDRTKGGYVMNYWGEELPTISIRGNTGSSGIEGINVLHQVYRAEQYTFDPVALTIASDPTVSGLGDLVSSAGNLLGGVGGGIAGGLINGIAGLSPLTQSLMPTNPPTLAALAFTVEMYYSGIVYRGCFTSMTVNEQANTMGLFDYTMDFTVTQTRGYRLNQFAFSRDPSVGTSDSSNKGNLSYKY